MCPIKLGVVGLGALGELHVSNLRYRIPAAAVTAVCDIRHDRVKAVRAKYDIPEGYTDFNKMITTADLDAVVIATNVSAHEEQCIQAVQAGRHVFCEKPLAPSVEACRHIERAVEHNPGLVFTIGYMRRFDPAYAEAMRRIRDGEIGAVIMFKGSSLDPASVLPQHLAGVRNGLYTPFLCEMGIHDADLARWFLNSEMVSVYAVGGAYAVPEFAEFHDYDHACALARFENGTTAFFEVSRLHAASHVHSEIIGTQGVIRVNDIPDISRLEQFDGRGYVRTCEHTFLDRWAEAYRLELADFVRCIETGCPSSICVYDGAKSLRMVNMMQAAYEKDAVVTDGG